MNKTLYDQLGEDKITRLVDSLYAHMAVLPEAQTVHAMHRGDMDELKRRLCAFLSGWLGGPDRYRPHYGEPRMRRRHMRFPIDSAARDGWMLCLKKALGDCIDESELRKELEQTFMTMADHMRNRPEAGETLPRCQCGSQTQQHHNTFRPSQIQNF